MTYHLCLEKEKKDLSLYLFIISIDTNAISFHGDQSKHNKDCGRSSWKSILMLTIFLFHKISHFYRSSGTDNIFLVIVPDILVALESINMITDAKVKHLP